MRRIATALGALPIAGLLTLTAPAAHAATGTLTIEGQPPYTNPSGCYDFTRRPPLRIFNQTDRPAYIFREPHCQGGGPEKIIQPTDGPVPQPVYSGASLFIP